MIGVAGPLWHHAHAVRAEQIGAAHRTRLSRWTHERMPQLSSALSAPAMDERAHPVASAGEAKAAPAVVEGPQKRLKHASLRRDDAIGPALLSPAALSAHAWRSSPRRNAGDRRHRLTGEVQPQW
jgi:hypothetical protein